MPVGIRNSWLVASLLLLVSVPIVADESPEPIRFSRDVLPVLTKSGCNAGICHGSFKGRGGLRLSLLGFDPQADFEALVKEARGRRVIPTAAGKSLLLQKPSGGIPHGGGVRFETDSTSFAILRRWIESGTTPPRDTDPKLLRLEVSPISLLMEPNQQARLQVAAVWADGVTRDVTAWVLYSVTDAEIATASEMGEITSLAPGRTAVVIRYGGLAATVAVKVPFTGGEPLPETPRHNFIDDYARAAWQEFRVSPAPVCDDATFLRRVSLDLIGTLPTPDELRTFVASTDADKRSQAIDVILERSEYVDYWSLRWSDLLRAHRQYLGDKGLASFRTWLRDQFRLNRPWDETVRQILTAQGNLYTNGPAAFYFVDKTPAELSETTAQVFLGVRMQCARCHHHPFEAWGQEDYYGLAAFFAKVKRKDTKEGGRFGGAQAVLLADDGQVTVPGRNTGITPRVLGGQPLEQGSGDPRPHLATWLTSPENPYFAKNVVNRYWGYLFGRGLVHPIDDLRETNPPSHPELLNALAADLAAQHFDLKHLLRTICNSHAYQLSAELNPQRDVHGEFLTHHVPRRLPAEVLLDAVNAATGASDRFPNLPVGMRAIELPDPAVASDFLDIYGRSPRATTCECERQIQPDLRQALHLANSEALVQKLSAQAGRVAQLIAAGRADNEIVDELYLATLSRWPDDEERAAVTQFLTAAATRQEGFEDLLWTLLNCAEFSFHR